MKRIISLAVLAVSAIGLEAAPILNNELGSALNEAVRNGDRSTFKMLLKRGADPNFADAAGTPLLMNAVIYGDAECVRMLLVYGADPNAKNSAGATALLWSAGDPEKAALLLSHGAYPDVPSALGRTPLLAASAQSEGAPVAKMLIEKGASLNAKDSLHGIPGVPNGGGGAIPLIEAAKARDGVLLRSLLARGDQDVNTHDSNGGTALTEAAILGNTDNVELLLKAGADVKAAAGTSKFTPLVVAVMRNDKRMVKMLIDAGADVNVKDGSGSTPMMWAAYNERGTTGVIEMLHAAGADPNVKNKQGESALVWAKRNGDTPIVQCLLKWNAVE